MHNPGTRWGWEWSSSRSGHFRLWCLFDTYFTRKYCFIRNYPFLGLNSISSNEKWGRCLPPAFMLVCCSAYSWTLNMEAIFSSETSVDFERTTRRYIPEVSTLHNHRCENLKSEKWIRLLLVNWEGCERKSSYFVSRCNLAAFFFDAWLVNTLVVVSLGEIL
jgi:hypothetical protein